ncbi:aminopeptidase N-like [Eupeodes corollae]|uniref:aminopeptidase N-like n=1 Tax=Eupeodes corollae TaxID=290404 RepID=UPI0024926AA5|nr:aminopeptidase N-like [Eupeodes corollae]
MKTIRKEFNSSIVIGLVVFLCCFTNSPTKSSEVHLQTPSSIRLPTSIQPIKYNLHINSSIHENNLDFSGNVAIEIVVRETTSEIVLHAKQLRDLVISLKEDRSRRRFSNLKYSLQEDKDFLRISTPKTLNVGERYRLEIIYTGKIQEEFQGIYRTSYLYEYYNKSIPLAVTQFQPTHARLAFPCFDEPSFRAKFVITITHGRFYTALSNMPIYGQPSWNNNMITTVFRETPTMPTYLVGFVICDFHFISYFDKNNSSTTEHRVFFPLNSKDMGSRAITNSYQAVSFFENYLGIAFPLPKLDHIHVKDADMVAMDWGLAIYNDNEFLQTLEDRDSTVKRIVLQNYIVSQQWFANMLPHKWWSHAWLNSGLGTYFSYEITDLMYPSWKMGEYFILTEVKELLKLDLKDPLVRKVETQAGIDSLTSDDAPFQMGACIIKMFHHAIGNETFTKGLRYYVNKFKNSNVDEDDFFGALQKVVIDENAYPFQIDKSLHEVMKTWTNNRGIPIVRVTRNYHNNGTLVIQQSPYNGNTNDKWGIPLNFATASNADFDRTTTDYIMPPVARVSLNLKDININLKNRDWLILNKQQTGLYYVIYDDRNLELIAEALNDDPNEIHKLNRALLFRDLLAILDTDLEAIEPVLELLKYLKNEQDSLPWFEASELINELWARLKDGKAFELFRTFINDIIGNFYNNFFELPLYKLSFADSIVKKAIYKLACEVELSECLAYATNQTKEYLMYNWPMDESLKRFTLCKAMGSMKSDDLGDILEKIFYTSISWAKEKEFLNSLHCISLEENIDLIFESIHKGEWTTRKMSISNYMEFYHPSFHKKTMNASRVREIRGLKEDETTRKHQEFKRKYEEAIYKWLKDYESKLRF